MAIKNSKYDDKLAEKLEEAKLKLNIHLKENYWTGKMDDDTYPVTFTFTKQQMPSMFDTLAPRSQSPEIIMIFGTDLEFVLDVPENEAVEEKFFNKLKNIVKEVHSLLMQHYFMNNKFRSTFPFTPNAPICEDCLEPKVKCVTCGEYVCIVCNDCDCKPIH